MPDHERRITDPYLSDILTRLSELEKQEELKCSQLDAILKTVETTASDVAAVKEIIAVWNNAKGFVKTVDFLAKVVKILWFPVTLIMAIYYLAKTGTWPK